VGCAKTVPFIYDPVLEEDESSEGCNRPVKLSFNNCRSPLRNARHLSIKKSMLF
jgi:hypothetical protein